jgi:hypothetical protein
MFYGSRNKPQSFVLHLHLKLVGGASHFSKHQQQFQYTFRLQVGKAIAQVQAYMINEGMNLADVPALMTILKRVFRDRDHVAIGKRKLEVLKHTNRGFSTHLTEFSSFVLDIQ